MWGVIGFGFAALVFAFFAFTVQKELIKKSEHFNSKHFAIGMYIAAGACLLWAIAALLNSSSALSASIIVGDVLLVAATLYILNAWISDENRWPAIVGVGLVGIFFVLARIFIFTPNAYMRDGLLFLNTPRLLAALLVVMFFSIWFIANYRFFKIVSERLRIIPGIGQITYIFNIAAFVGICGFLIARKPLTIVISFITFTLCYLFLTYVVIVARKEALHHG